MKRSLWVLLCLIGAAAPASAQAWRTVHTTRGTANGTDSVAVRMRYAMGELTVAAAPAGVLYDVRMRYDRRKGMALARFDEATRTLTIESDSSDARARLGLRRFAFGSDDDGDGEHDHARASIALAREVPLALALRVTAAQANLDFTNLTLSDLSVRSTASDTRVTFGTRNPVRLPELEIRGVATEVAIRQLGNANAERVDLRVIAGELEVDVSGEWTGTMDVRADVLLGALTLRVPNDVGVRLEWNGMLGELAAPGFVVRDGARFSPNWDTAARKLTVEADARLGGLTVEWIER
ncbi:MAG TPA: hypothetical protein VJ596_06180 [Gemmatimonadaceae bacterium]|nr:hypothetical protein [Gemmatimonadaceae bacterium]